MPLLKFDKDATLTTDRGIKFLVSDAYACFPIPDQPQIIDTALFGRVFGEDSIKLGNPGLHWYGGGAIEAVTDVHALGFKYSSPLVGYLNPDPAATIHPADSAIVYFTQKSLGGQFLDEARNLRLREHPLEPVKTFDFADLDAYFGQKNFRGELKYPHPWTHTIWGLPPQLRDTPEKRLAAVLYYEKSLRKAAVDGLIDPEAPPAPGLERPKGPGLPGTAVNSIDVTSLFTLVEAYKKS